MCRAVRGHVSRRRPAVAHELEQYDMGYALIRGFIVRTGERSEFNHVQGGACSHRGGHCTSCDRPLLKLWQIDCGDPRLVSVETGVRVFAGLENLPLYYCWRCGGEVAYRIDGPAEITMLMNTGSDQGDDFPYSNYPLAFPESPLRLYCPEDVPTNVRACIERSREVFDKLPEDERELLSHFLQRPIRRAFDVWVQQFGGEPYLIQGPENNICPNPECELHRDGETMRILAGPINDPPGGLPMIESLADVAANNGHFDEFVQVVFHFCPSCHSVHATNRRD